MNRMGRLRQALEADVLGGRLAACVERSDRRVALEAYARGRYLVPRGWSTSGVPLRDTPGYVPPATSSKWL